MALNRGIEELPPRLGNLLELVEKRIAEQGKVRILDAGCGHGNAMIGFVKTFKEKVEMYGLNYSQHYGKEKTMVKEAIDKGIFNKEEISKLGNLPKFIYGDASKELHFDSDFFDFIYSIHALHYFEDKVHFIQECIWHCWNSLPKKTNSAKIS